MDVYCQKCGEPWDYSELAEFTIGFDGGTGKDFKTGKGCPACDWGRNLDDLSLPSILRARLSNTLFITLGDDIDGIAAESEDLDSLGFFEEM